MRHLIALSVLLLLCGVAVAQSDWVPPGTYAQPFAPRLATPSASPEAIQTPSLTLDTPALVAGASSSTVTSPTGPGVHFNRPPWYAPGVLYNLPDDSSGVSTASGQVLASPGTPVGPSEFNTGAAMFQDSYGAAQLAARSARKSRRIYANADVARVNDTNGLIKHGGKTEQLN